MPITSVHRRCSATTSFASGTRRRGGFSSATTTRRGRRSTRRFRIAGRWKSAVNASSSPGTGPITRRTTATSTSPPDTLMMVDIVNAGWVPVYNLNLTEDRVGYVAVPDHALSYPWTHLISGHFGRLGTRDDVKLHQQYIADISENARTALATVDPTPYFQKYGANAWAAVKGYLDEVANTAAAPVIEIHRCARRRHLMFCAHDFLAAPVHPARPRRREPSTPVSDSAESSRSPRSGGRSAAWQRATSSRTPTTQKRRKHRPDDCWGYAAPFVRSVFLSLRWASARCDSLVRMSSDRQRIAVRRLASCGPR